MTDAPKPPNRRRRRIVVVMVAVLVLGMGWWFWPRVDQRFVGRWLWSSGEKRILEFDLRGDRTGVAFDSKGTALPVRWWRDGPSLCISMERRSMTDSIIHEARWMFDKSYSQDPRWNHRGFRFYIANCSSDQLVLHTITYSQQLRSEVPKTPPCFFNRMK